MKTEIKMRWEQRDILGKSYWFDQKELHYKGHSACFETCPDLTETFTVTIYETSSEKVNAVAEIVKDLVRNGTKILVAINEAIDKARGEKIFLTESEYGDLVERFPAYGKLLDEMKRQGIA